MPVDTEKIQAYLDANPKVELNLVVMYILVQLADNGKGTKPDSNQLTLQPEATPNVDMSCPNSPGQQEEIAQKCRPPLSAMEDIEPSGVPPLHHIVNPELHVTSAGDYEDLP